MSSASRAARRSNGPRPGINSLPKPTPSRRPPGTAARVVPEPQITQPKRTKTSHAAPRPPGPPHPGQGPTADQPATLIPPAMAASRRLLLTCPSSATVPGQASPAANQRRDPPLGATPPNNPNPSNGDRKLPPFTQPASGPGLFTSEIDGKVAQ